MKVTGQKGLDLIKQFEGLRLKAYDDGVGVWTIGYGTIRYPNGVKVKRGDTCTKEQAEQYLKTDLDSFENVINTKVKVPLTQNQFDALACFVYNVGATNFSNSTLLRKLNAKDYSGAADQLLRWNKAGGKVMNGLTRRREAERKLFLSQ